MNRWLVFALGCESLLTAWSCKSYMYRRPVVSVSLCLRKQMWVTAVSQFSCLNLQTTWMLPEGCQDVAIEAVSKLSCNSTLMMSRHSLYLSWDWRVDSESALIFNSVVFMSLMIQSEMPAIFGAVDYCLFWLCVASVKVHVRWPFVDLCRVASMGFSRRRRPKRIQTRVPLKDKCLLIICRTRSYKSKTLLCGKEQ